MGVLTHYSGSLFWVHLHFNSKIEIGVGTGARTGDAGQRTEWVRTGIRWYVTLPRSWPLFFSWILT